jgi:zinc transporter, ZIP family
MDWHAIGFAFGLTLFAGLATGVGSAIAFIARKTNTRFLSLLLGFSGGVMIYVSLIEIFAKAKTSLVFIMGERSGYWLPVASFFSGMIIMAIIDHLVPEMGNPHELKRIEEAEHPSSAFKKKKLLRMGLLSAVAIAIHNIPEGIAVSVPVYYATGNKKKTFKLSFLSGTAEPLGALIGYILLMPFMSDAVFGVLFASVAGVMVYISLDELLPAAREYGQAHITIYGVISGMIVMAVSLLLFV